MAHQLTSNTLSPQLQAVLSSLNINLEAELNRYRRNSFTEGSTSKDLFADLEDDSAFDLDAVDAAVTLPAAALPLSPPPVPRNKRIFPDESGAHDQPSNALIGSATGSTFHLTGSASQTSSPETSSPDRETLNASPPSIASADILAASSALTFPEAKSSDSANEAAGILTTKNLSANTQEAAITPGTSTAATPGGYLTSSEKLIESLSEVPSMPDPVASAVKPKRKTVSLLMGALLGFFALVAGLGASYLMSNPSVAQRFADGFKRGEGQATTASNSSFDPPGPDLSAREFIDLEIDNLSSLKMPQTTIDPASKPAATGVPISPIALPPIANGAVQPRTNLPNQTVASQPNPTQASLIPAGSNYYITVPFSTEQGLIQIRQTVNEAFVRQYADGGNRIQLAAFDNATSAQQFIEELKAQGVTAQVYGPTAE
ncbi:MAG: hypothetical protein AAFO84_17060 [Cyanobacteria bacterium J06598_1]